MQFRSLLVSPLFLQCAVVALSHQHPANDTDPAAPVEGVASDVPTQGRSRPGIALSPTLSESCAAAYLELASGDIATCSGLREIGGVASALAPKPSLGAHQRRDPNNGDPTPLIHGALEGVCHRAPCAAPQLQGAVDKLRSACAADLAKNVSMAVTLDGLVSNAQDFKAAFCLKSKTSNAYCLIEILKSDAAEAPHQHHHSSPLDFFGHLGPNVSCSECTKSMWTIMSGVSKRSPNLGLGESLTKFGEKCGKSFTDETMPSSIEVVAPLPERPGEPKPPTSSASTLGRMASLKSARAKAAASVAAVLGAGVWAKMLL